MTIQAALQAVAVRAEALWERALEVWLGGGWAMIAIATIAFVMFAVGVSLQVRLRAKGFLAVPERKWRRWIDHPEERRGPIGKLLESVAGASTVEESSARFRQLHASETVPFERDLKVMRVCVSAAPLVGLLGTVIGMLATFGALSSGSGGDKTMALVAKGISEALITTETGLVIALPGLFFQYQLTRKTERYKAFLAHLETVCTQTIHGRTSDVRRERVRQAALRCIARSLLEQRARERQVEPGQLVVAAPGNGVADALS